MSLVVGRRPAAGRNALYSGRGPSTSGTRSRAGRRPAPTSDTSLRERAIAPLPRIREAEANDAMHPQDPSAPTAWLGSDVSQHTLDAGWLLADGKPRAQAFRNAAAGHAALLAWAEGSCPAGTALGFCLESTGAYGTALATTLAEA